MEMEDMHCFSFVMVINFFMVVRFGPDSICIAEVLRKIFCLFSISLQYLL